MRWNIDRRGLLAGGVAAGAAAIWVGFDTGLLGDRSPGVARQLATPLDGPANPATASELTAPLLAVLGARTWLNTPPLGQQDLLGKVVLVNFWTYSCINSLRPLPYLRAWAERYRERGLVMVGVHTPEFTFEKDVSKVTEATAMQDIDFPVALDSDYVIWRAFDNQAWPGFYFIGADGRIRHRSFGEGAYVEAERRIQKLLAEMDGAPAEEPISEVRGEGVQAAPDWSSLRSPETYIGYAQARNFASPGGARADLASRYEAPPTLSLNRWTLTGVWTIGREFATLVAPSGGIRHQFRARDVHLVLGGPANRQPVRFRVTIDGAAPGADKGSDTDGDGWGTLREDRLYQLVRQAGPVRDRTFAIEFSGPGVRAYAFTFG